MKQDIIKPTPRQKPQPSQAESKSTNSELTNYETFTSETLSLAEITPKNRYKKPFVIAGILFIAAAALSLLAATIWYNSQLSPLAEKANYVPISITPGSGSATIANQLEEKKIIQSSSAFRWYLRLNGNPSLQAGSYKLSAQQSVSRIVEILSKGQVSMFDILIPPGLRLDQIQTVLIKSGYTKAEVEAGLLAARTHTLVKKLPKNTPLEGYIFPDTYKIGFSTDVKTLLELTFDTFQKQITPDIEAGLAAQGIPLSKAVILASIVQKEVADHKTQRIVAQVFIKRLKEGKPLGADPTFKYAAKMLGVPATPELDSPYNTRIYTGLPPTPISNFNISALKAVANPAKTNYNYFVAGDDGITHFTNTLAQHEAATRKYCTKLCQ